MVRRFRFGGLLPASIALLLAMSPLAARAVVDGATIDPSRLGPGGSHSWLARIPVGGGAGICTGVLVSPSAVLTGAHCAVESGQSVEIGTVVTLPVRSVHVHPSWRGESEFDVALLVLGASAAAQPLTMATAPDGVATGSLLRVAGWGETGGDLAPAEGTMQVAQLANGLFHATAAPSAMCDGDSGGPLMTGRPGIDARLVGIASAGVTRPGCQDILAVRVADIQPWVASVTGTGPVGSDRPPQVLSGSLVTTMNTPVMIPLEFSDPDGVPMGFESIVAADSTGGEVIGCMAETIPTLCQFDPAAGFIGTATFSYTVSDGNREATAQWTIEVQPPSGPVIEVAGRTFEEPAHGRRRVTVDIVMSQPAARPVKVTLTPRDGTAVNGADFVAKPDTVTIRAGQTRATYSFFILADKESEPVESFDLLVAAQGATPLQPAATMLIDRNGPNLAPVVRLEGPLKVTTDEQFEIVIDFHDPDGTPMTLDNLVDAVLTNLEVLRCGDEFLPYTCTFIAPEGFVGTASLAITVSDGVATTTGIWTVQVLPEP